MAVTTTQIIPGALRETSNPLLLKADIGKPLKRGFTIPAPNFTYGIINQGKCIGTGHVLSNWHTHLKNSSNDAPYFSQKDFIKMNKSAINLGLISAKECCQYQTKNSFLKKKEPHMCRSRVSLPANVVYGVPTKSSMPINDLLEHKYHDYMQEEQQLYLAKLCREKKNDLSRRSRSYSETRASRLRRHSPSVDATPLWQMPKFQKNALPVIETFRNEAAREKAFLKHRTDSTARTGIFSHGTCKEANS